MKIRIYLLSCLVSLLFALHLEGRHIIGGQIKYECMDINNYTITARVYRDCGGNGAFFDDPATFTIYKANGADFDLVGTFNPVPQNISTVELVDAPCLMVPDVACIDQADYIFNTPLPVINESYFIIYQRCCRSATVSNLINPEGTGMTLSIEILPSAQGVCNSSPEFSELNSPFACVNDNLSIDLSTTDADGDGLVYEFCSPKAGGGLGGSADGPPNSSPSACDGVAPMPACPPPFLNVDFILPEYSALHPMGGNVSINSSTGFISGVPEFIGQYVVGACVKEYRNGELLSISRKDFQISTIQCDQTIDPPKLEHGIIAWNGINIFTCGETEWQFVITSFTEAFVDNILWEIVVDNSGTLESSTEWSPVFNFTGLGAYAGQVTINEGLPCATTFPIEINTLADCSILSTNSSEEFSTISIFPNPTSDVLNISYPDKVSINDIHIRVLDFQGKEIGVYQKGLQQLETKNWSPGIYLLQLGTKKEWKKTTRIIIFR